MYPVLRSTTAARVPNNGTPSDRTSTRLISGNNLICDCKLTWIWGLRNETKNRKLRDALEELTCFLEEKINNEDLDDNEALEITRNPGGLLFLRATPFVLSLSSRHQLSWPLLCDSDAEIRANSLNDLYSKEP